MNLSPTLNFEQDNYSLRQGVGTMSEGFFYVQDIKMFGQVEPQSVVVGRYDRDTSEYCPSFKTNGILSDRGPKGDHDSLKLVSEAKPLDQAAGIKDMSQSGRNAHPIKNNLPVTIEFLWGYIIAMYLLFYFRGGTVTPFKDNGARQKIGKLVSEGGCSGTDTDQERSALLAHDYLQALVMRGDANSRRLIAGMTAEWKPLSRPVLVLAVIGVRASFFIVYKV